MTNMRAILSLVCCCLLARELAAQPARIKTISRGGASGSYQAFPDLCRLANGDLLAVFYAGYTHISVPNAEYPKGGRICMVRSADEGITWSLPAVLFDDDLDNRDPHIAQLRDGTLVCSFFSLRAKGADYEFPGVQLVRSRDGGKTWDKTAEMVLPDWVCSAPVRELKDGTCLLGVYREKEGKAYGGVIRSLDHGKTWEPPVPIGLEAGLPLDAETDVIQLKDGSLFAALRSSRVNMHYSRSSDLGKTWSPVADIGFKGHSPHLNRLGTGEVLLTHRVPNTALHISRDDAKTWQGPYSIDTCIGAYPSTVELKDRTVLVIYYTEGAGSVIQASRFRLAPDGISFLTWP